MHRKRIGTISRSGSAHSGYTRISRRPLISKKKLLIDVQFRVSQLTEDFIVNVAKSVDGKTFTLFIKYLSELRTDVLDNPLHKLTPDSFLIFLDKIKTLTHSAQLNDLILRKISNINIDELKAKRMLNLYQ